MDPIVTKLNKVAIEKIAKGGMPQISPDESSGFQKTLDKTMTDRVSDRMMDKIKEDYGMGPQDAASVLSAENIQVNSSTMPEQGGKTGANDSFFDTFKEMNRDLLSLDSALETLTTPGLKVSPRQLLALQAGMSNTTILVEAVSRSVDAGARGVQTIVQMQV